MIGSHMSSNRYNRAYFGISIIALINKKNYNLGVKMIKDIPFCFKDKNEDYLVIESLQTFCKDNNLHTVGDKMKLIENIVEYANLSEENEEIVLEWIDTVLKEGIKKIIISKILYSTEIVNKTIEEWKEMINDKFSIYDSKHIITGIHTNDIKLQTYKLEESNGFVEKISLIFTILLKEEKNKGVTQTIIYPIFIDIDIKNKYIIGRAKSKSSISKFKMYKNGEEEIIKSTTCDKLTLEVFEILKSKFDIEEESKERRDHIFKGRIHSIVDECTRTPKEIMDKIETESDNINAFVKNFFSRHDINPFSDENYNNAIDDIKVFIEKYLSINYEDQSIFTQDRYAYPTKIAATDSDFSSIDESSSDNKPLQCTSIFFDNKKLIQREKKCDNVVFIFKREQKLYFTNKTFSVILEVKKGRMHIDFRKYTLEEDINNVLSRIIRTSR